MTTTCRLAAVGVLLGVVGVTATHVLRDRRPGPLGVVLITLDTTRADRLSAYGFMDVAMPALDRLAREGVVFEQAASVAPLTLPAHASIMTGLLPPSHGVRDNADAPLAASQTTLAEILRARGFRTGAFVGSVVLDAGRGLGQGFDRYGGVANDASPTPARQRRADEVMTEADAWLDEHGASPFFLWAHLYDAHAPYDPPEPYRSAHPDPYIAEILFADAQVGRLLDALERRRLLERTIVVIAGDHGEALGEHGEPNHGLFVYQSVLRVPLMIRAPGIRPSHIADVVSLVDVAPTILELAGVPAPRTDGASLVGLMTGRSRPDLEAYAESLYPQRFGLSPYHALRERRYKLIDGTRPELYDLERDPFEERNIYAERGDVARAMRARLQEIAGVAGSSGTDAGLSQDVPLDLRERLAALGYVSSAGARAQDR